MQVCVIKSYGKMNNKNVNKNVKKLLQKGEYLSLC